MIRKVFILTGLFLLPFFLLSQKSDDWSDLITVINEHHINSELAEFSPVYSGDYIVYVGVNSRIKNSDKAEGDGFDLFISAPARTNRLEKSAYFDRLINTVYDEGPASFTRYGDTIYYGHLDYKSAEANRFEGVYTQIYTSVFDGNEWSEPAKLTINKDTLSSCHPSVDNKQQLMLLSSDRKEGFGKMDIYISERKNGEWTTPKNLGPKINSSANDWFPFLHQDGYIFFAAQNESTGLDIYRSKLDADLIPGKAVRLPEPINSPFDDFGFICDATGRSGYFSSNRPGGKGMDDIYAYEASTSIFAFGDNSYNLVDMTVIAKSDGSPYSGAKIRFKKINEEQFKAFDDKIFLFDPNEAYDSLYTNSAGKATVKIFDGHTLIEVKGADTESWTKVIANDVRNSKITVELISVKSKPLASPQPIGENIARDEVLGEVDINVGSVLVFDNIYYDYNSFEIKKGAAEELDALARIMRTNKDIKILLSAHTDARGEKMYNLNLSFKRAQSAKNYLTQQGIHPARIITEGFGEEQIRNHCTNGVKCSEADHNFNRRTEVKIIEN